MRTQTLCRDKNVALQKCSFPASCTVCVSSNFQMSFPNCAGIHKKMYADMFCEVILYGNPMLDGPEMV